MPKETLESAVGLNEKIYRLFCRCFLVLFSIFIPIALVGISSLADVILSPLLLLGAVGLIVLFVSLLKRGRAVVQWVFAPLALAVLGILPRIFILGYLGAEYTQVGDYATALASSQTLPYIGAYFRVFSTWIMQVYYLSLMPTAFFGMCMNALLTVMAGVLLYYLALQAGLGRSTAVGAGLIFLWQPSLLLYAPVLSPELPHLFLAVLAMNIFMLAKKRSGFSAYALYVLAGVVFCLADLFRSVVIIYLIACAIVFMVRRSRKSLIGLVVAGIVCTMLTPLAYNAAETASGESVNRSLVGHFLYMGLTKGYWTVETSQYYPLAKANDFDYEKTSRELMERLLEERKADKWPSLFLLIPMKLAFGLGTDDYTHLIYDGLSAEMQESLPITLFATYIRSYYALILLGIVYSARAALKKTNMGLIFFAQIVMVGFTLLMLLSEVQPRYKIVLYPLMALCAAYGFEERFTREGCLYSELPHGSKLLLRLKRKM